MLRVQDVLLCQLQKIVVDGGDQQHLVVETVAVVAKILVPERLGDVVPHHVHGLHRLDVLHVLRQGGAVGGGQGVDVYAHVDLKIVVDQQKLPVAHGGVRVLRHRHLLEVGAQVVGGAPAHVAGSQQTHQRRGVLLAGHLAPAVRKGHLVVVQVDHVHAVRRRRLENHCLPALGFLLPCLDPAHQSRPVGAGAACHGDPPGLLVGGHQCQRVCQRPVRAHLGHAAAQRTEGHAVRDILLVRRRVRRVFQLRDVRVGGVSVAACGSIPHDQHRHAPLRPLNEAGCQLLECNIDFRQSYSHQMFPSSL